MQQHAHFAGALQWMNPGSIIFRYLHEQRSIFKEISLSFNGALCMHGIPTAALLGMLVLSKRQAAVQQTSGWMESVPLLV